MPASLVALLAVVLVIWVPFSRSVAGRAAYASGSSEAAAYMSGVPIRRGKFAAYTLAGLLAAIGGLFLTFFTYTGEAAYASGNAYTLFSIAAVVLGGVSLFGGKGSAIGAIFGALAFRTIGDLLFVFDFDPLWQPLFQGVVLLIAVSLGAFAPVPRAQPAGVVPMSDATNGRSRAACRASCAASIRRSRRPSPASCCCSSSAASIRPSFLSPEYLLQQLKVASFLGVIATGMMLVILLGQIDLSVPWVGGGRRHDGVGGGRLRRRSARSLAIPFGIFCGVADRPRQRHRRRLSAHPLDDHHARHQRRGAGADGRLHRRLLAAGFRLGRDALPGDRLPAAGRAQCRRHLGGASARRPCSCSPARPSAAPSTRIGNRERAAYPLRRRHAARRDDRLRHLRRA